MLVLHKAELWAIFKYFKYDEVAYNKYKNAASTETLFRCKIMPDIFSYFVTCF